MADAAETSATEPQYGSKGSVVVLQVVEDRHDRPFSLSLPAAQINCCKVLPCAMRFRLARRLAKGPLALMRLPEGP